MFARLSIPWERNIQKRGTGRDRCMVAPVTHRYNYANVATRHLPLQWMLSNGHVWRRWRCLVDRQTKQANKRPLSDPQWQTTLRPTLTHRQWTLVPLDSLLKTNLNPWRVLFLSHSTTLLSFFEYHAVLDAGPISTFIFFGLLDAMYQCHHCLHLNPMLGR